MSDYKFHIVNLPEHGQQIMLYMYLIGVQPYVHNTFKEDVTTVRKPSRLANGVSVSDEHAAQR